MEAQGRSMDGTHGGLWRIVKDRVVVDDETGVGSIPLPTEWRDQFAQHLQVKTVFLFKLGLDGCPLFGSRIGDLFRHFLEFEPQVPDDLPLF